MHFTNLSQVLERNEDLIKGDQPLLINMPDDDLGKYIQQLNPSCELSFYDTNYQQHVAHKALANVHCTFAAHYKTNITHDLVILSFPKSKNELTFTLAMLAECTTTNSKLLIVGENKSGIKSIAKLVKNYTLFCDKQDSARHCVLYEAQLNNHQNTFKLEDWFTYYNVEIKDIKIKVAALPGVFSQTKLDIGTAVLLENTDVTMTGDVLDFGCGAGVIACYLGLTQKDINLNLADVSALALCSSLKSLEINQLSGKTIATNSLSNIAQQYNFVISNPPFHQGIHTHYAATESFLTNIKQHLKPKGILTIVANSFLKYQPILEQSIGKVAKLAVKQGFTVYQVQRR